MKTSTKAIISLGLSIVIILLICMHNIVKVYLEKQEKIAEISQFIGKPIGDLSLECSSNNFELIKDGKDQAIRICLSPTDKSKRCEIVVSDLHAYPAVYDMSFDVKEEEGSPSEVWHMLFQVHEYKDFGEVWRCPPLAVEILNKEFRVFNRWDVEQITKTDRNGCVAPNGSIQAREVLKNISVHYDEWQHVSIKMKASPFDDGELNVRISAANSGTLKGGNFYNDKNAPFLKFGVYKPAGWSQNEINSKKPICAQYKNFTLKSTAVIRP